MADKLPEMSKGLLAVVWAAIAISAFTASFSYGAGDTWWGITFTAFTAFFGIVAFGAHTQRRWNRTGIPPWARRARGRKD